MTKRMDPSERKIAARDDLTPKPRKKRGANATPEGKAKRQAALAASGAVMSNNGNTALIEKQNPDRPLTEKQRLFVSEWAKGETILSASYRAGYADAGTMAYRMAKDPAILKLYNAEKALYAESCQINRKQVMEGLIEAIDMAKLLGEPASMIAGWREVGKMCGFYEPVKRTIDINIQGDVTVKRLERMSDADLLKLIKNDDIADVVFEQVAADEAEAEGEDE